MKTYTTFVNIPRIYRCKEEQKKFKKLLQNLFTYKQTCSILYIYKETNKHYKEREENIMYIIGKVTPLTSEEVFGNFYRDEHNNDGVYVEKVIKKVFAQVTEYRHNARQYKTEKAANTALDTLTDFSGKNLRDAGYAVIEY
jgi:hypothetical protein